MVCKSAVEYGMPTIDGWKHRLIAAAGTRKPPLACEFHPFETTEPYSYNEWPTIP
jgi:hypothetical protein